MPSRRRLAPVIGRDGIGTSSGKEQEISTVEIDGTFAQLLGLMEGQRLGVFLHLDPPVAHTVNIEPLTPGDWEIIELHATFLELNLLSQIRALPNPAYSSSVSVQAEHSHPLTLHLSPTSTANIIITSLIPPIPNTSPFAKIAPDAEVIVAPKVRPKSSRGVHGDSRSVASRRSGKSGASTSRPGSRRANSRGGSALYLRGVDRTVCRAWFEGDCADDENKGLRLWLDKDVMASNHLRGMAWASVSVAKPAGLRAQLDQQRVQRLKEEEVSEVGLPTSRVVARILPWRKPPDTNHAGLSSALCILLGVEGLVGLVVRIEAATPSSQRSTIKALKIYPFLSQSQTKGEGLKIGGNTKASQQALVERLRVAHGNEDGLLSGPVTDGMLLPPSSKTDVPNSFDGGIVRFDPPPAKDQDGSKPLRWLIGSEQNHRLEAQTEIPRPLALTTMFPSFANALPDAPSLLVGVDDTLKECMTNLRLCSSILLTGGIGSGKTSLAQNLCQRLREDYLFNATYFSCRKMVTDETRVSAIRETLTRLFMSALWCARLGGHSVVVLDDLDKICPVETELQVGNDNGRSRQVTELVCAIVREYCGTQLGVALIATAQSKDSLNNIMIGGHIVGDIVSLKAPDKERRRMILEQFVHIGGPSRITDGHVNSRGRYGSDSNDTNSESWLDPSNPSSRPGSSASSASDDFQISPNLDLLDVAGNTDGYMPADLVLLVSRARNEALIRTLGSVADSMLTLNRADFEAALKNFTPSSLRNVTLTHSTTTFSSIGGLRSTRNTLLETLLYPTKYAPIFARSPLRLRSGLLLYGYPGCGKTLLASAVAGECNLNFISVKGPEILNKYIGASEKSVRDLFERAQAAKPCVLFFDEFDSIAPKRGHDSTGVTDRVVNQMLTQMDGAEGLEGVYVLAATSRPDLIDPALLRPGRLDKSLLCDMPDAQDREDILTAVSEKLNLRSEVSAQKRSIAQKTGGFSGADLQALMYNAHLEAIHDLLGDNFDGVPDKSFRSSEAKPNGPIQQSKSGKSKHDDFIQFLYGPLEDAELHGSITHAAHDSHASIASKLDALKQARKRENELSKGPYPSFGPEARSAAPDSKTSAKEEVWIQWKHIERALATTRGSISIEERRRLAAIYNEFVVGRNGEMPSGDGGREIGGRSSLM